MTDDQIQEFHGFWFEKAQNGLKCWSEADLMAFLGYADRKSFRKVVGKAQKAWLSLGNDPGREFRILDDNTYKFTRSACFMIAIQADSRKERVAQVQAYLVAIANEVLGHFDAVSEMDRAVIRDDLTDGMKALAATAKKHGVVRFGTFQDEGYRGMYNMSLEELTRLKKVPVGERLLDRMDRTELAANLFRVTQTEEKIRNENVRGQAKLEAASHEVGAVVRAAMIRTSGKAPEHLPIASTNIAEAKRILKGGARTIEAFDDQPRLTRLLHQVSAEPDDEPDQGFTPDPEADRADDDPPL